MTRPIHGGNLVWAASIAGCPADLITDFSASINPLGPPQSAIEAIQRGLIDLKSYPDPNYSQLKSSLADWHQLSPEWILPGNGSAELLTWASWELSEQKFTYLITPAFADYWRGLNAFGANVRRVQGIGEKGEAERGDGERREGRRVTGGEFFNDEGELDFSDAGLLLNNPHNPTGKLWSREEILPYLEKFALVVIDEAFMDFLPPQQDQSLIPFVEKYPNLVILRSLTKFYSLPGLRFGYAIAHPDRLKRWQQWRDPWSVNVLAAAAAQAVILDRDFQMQTWDWLVSAREKLFKGLASIPGLELQNGAANFLLVKTEQPSSQLQKKLLVKYKILIRDCLSFPELGDRYFRVAVRSQPDNQRLIEALKVI